VLATGLAVLAAGTCATEADQTLLTEEDTTTTAERDTTTRGSEAPAETTTTRSAVEPKPSLASPYLQGTLDVQLAAGESQQVSVIAVGPPQSATPVVVRNNTPDTVEVHLSATARSASGDLAGSGEDQGLHPAWVEPGQVAIGYVYFGIDDIPAGTTVDVTARGEEVADEPGALPAVIAEHNLAAGEFGQQVVGIVRNDNDYRMEGPISVLVMCFDETGAPLQAPGDFLDVDALDPGQEGSFSVDLFDATCPRYLVGVSGWAF
jgi:hypothetical protein